MNLEFTPLLNNVASATSVMAFKLGFEHKKIGNEGLILHYDLIQTIAKEFCKKYPENFDWESFYLKGGNDWDIVCEKFLDDYIQEHNIYIDTNYYND